MDPKMEKVSIGVQLLRFVVGGDKEIPLKMFDLLLFRFNQTLNCDTRRFAAVSLSKKSFKRNSAVISSDFCRSTPKFRSGRHTLLTFVRNGSAIRSFSYYYLLNVVYPPNYLASSYNEISCVLYRSRL